MQALTKYEVTPLHLPIEGYNFIVRTLTSIDGGQSYYYCGNSRYFKTEPEALAYKSEQEGAQCK